MMQNELNNFQKSTLYDTRFRMGLRNENKLCLKTIRREMVTKPFFSAFFPNISEYRRNVFLFNMFAFWAQFH